MLSNHTLKELSARSDAKGLAQLSGHGALLVVTAMTIVATEDTLWMAPALVLHGIVLIFLFAPLHESIHRTAFRSRRLNAAVAWGCGLLLLLPPAYFRAFHLTHHRHTQDPAKDPELAVAKPDSLGAYLWHVSGLPYWRERITTTLRHAVGNVTETFVAPRQKLAIVREARTVVAIYLALIAIALATASGAMVYFWLVPALLGQPALRLFLLAEHTGCPLVPDMLKNTRTTLSTALVRWLAWNMPYHAEHHAYPALPFHVLPQAHRLLQDEIVIQASGYGEVQREILAGFRATSPR